MTFIIALIILLVVLLGFYLHKVEQNFQLERIVSEQRKYIEQYNAWYKPKGLKEVHKEEVKKNYERDLKSLEDKFKRDIESFDRVSK